MSRSFCRVILAPLLLAGLSSADDQKLWNEYGLLHSETAREGKSDVTTYQFKDLTGAVAAWEWMRSPDARPCQLATFCTQDAKQTVISEANYVIVYGRPAPTKGQVEAKIKALPNRHDTSLPAILTFLPQQGRVPNSARYILGKVSLNAFAPELGSTKPGFEDGAEAQVVRYELVKGEPPVSLAVFYYPTPEMARLHAVGFKLAPGAHVRRSGVLVAVVYGVATDAQADTLLSRVQYEAKITWNETPPPSPIRPLYKLLVNIGYLSGVLTALCLAAGLMYALMRLYRRRYGSLEADEAMTTLHLRGEN